MLAELLLAVSSKEFVAGEIISSLYLNLFVKILLVMRLCTSCSQLVETLLPQLTSGVRNFISGLGQADCMISQASFPMDTLFLKQYN